MSKMSPWHPLYPRSLIKHPTVIINCINQLGQVRYNFLTQQSVLLVIRWWFYLICSTVMINYLNGNCGRLIICIWTQSRGCCPLKIMEKVITNIRVMRGPTRWKREAVVAWLQTVILINFSLYMFSERF